MSECLIIRRGGETNKLPILNSEYPEDVSTTVIKGNVTSATFVVYILRHGTPAEYTYQWYVDGIAVDGATDPVYTKSDLSTTATYNIYCKVTNTHGSVNSRIATLNVTEIYTPILNFNYPEDATVTLGNSITNKIMVSSDGNPMSYTYQWYENDVAVNGATDSTYNFTPFNFGTTSIYCKVTNSAGTVTSRTATITVNEAYLYQNGNINAITGGFEAYAYRPSIHDEGTLSKPTVRINSDSIELEAYGYDNVENNANITGSYFTVNAIDLTNVSKISVNMLDWENKNDDLRTDIRLVVTPSLKNSYTLSAHQSLQAIGEVRLDTTHLNGKYHIGFYLTGKTTKKIKFNELKLLR